MKTTSVNNRRYLGNKYRLLPFITSIVSEYCPEVSSFADLFAGTGAVASAFTSKQLILNDILYSNYICHLAWFSPANFSVATVAELISYYNSVAVTDDNYMSYTFGNTFFSVEVCRQIGYIREDIESRFLAGSLTERERALLITSLLYAADKIANTCGHYDAYRQVDLQKRVLELALPTTYSDLNPLNKCYNQDCNSLAPSLSADLVYLDPPYNSRQYCDTYHLLENIAQWRQPAVSGVARKMERSSLKSSYCTNKAAAAFDDLIRQISAKYILLSYNNMSQKGNIRSNAKLSDADILNSLRAKGEVRVFTQNHKPFSAGKSQIADNAERLFLCLCN